MDRVWVAPSVVSMVRRSVGMRVGRKVVERVDYSGLPTVAAMAAY